MFLHACICCRCFIYRLLICIVVHTERNVATFRASIWVIVCDDVCMFGGMCSGCHVNMCFGLCFCSQHVLHVSTVIMIIYVIISSLWVWFFNHTCCDVCIYTHSHTAFVWLIYHFDNHFLIFVRCIHMCWVFNRDMFVRYLHPKSVRMQSWRNENYYMGVRMCELVADADFLLEHALCVSLFGSIFLWAPQYMCTCLSPTCVHNYMLRLETCAIFFLTHVDARIVVCVLGMCP